MQPVPGSEFEIDADLVLLAMGFVHPVHEGLVKGLNVALDQRAKTPITIVTNWEATLKMLNLPPQQSPAIPEYNRLS